MVGLQIVEYPEKLSELFDGYLRQENGMFV